MKPVYVITYLLVERNKKPFHFILKNLCAMEMNEASCGERIFFSLAQVAGEIIVLA